MKQRIRAYRVVLTNGNVIMHYLDEFGFCGYAFAGSMNRNLDGLWTCSQKEFDEFVKDWYNKNKDNDDVEYSEII